MIRIPERIRLAHLPTEIHPLPSLSKRYGVEICIKRDDLTGVLTTGNKVRKLEFLVADALKKGCDTLVTCGGVQSNHARATAAIAARLRLGCVLLLRGTGDHPQGNLFLDRLLGARTVFVTGEEYRKREEKCEEVARSLVREGRKPYIIPEGGSSPIGAWGYILMMEELGQQITSGVPPCDSLVCAVGSGGTLAGLLLGKKIYNIPVRIFGINVADTASYFRERVMGIIQEAVSQYDLPVTVGEEEIEIIDGYVGRGYGLTREEELRVLGEVARQEGIILDPVYTGKAMYGLLDQITRDRGRFGQRVLFLHTGGIFSLFAYQEELQGVRS